MGISSIASAVSDPQQFLRQLGFIPAMIGPIVIDVVVKEAPQHGWELSRHKVGSGMPATDMRQKNPDVLVLDCVQGDKQYGLKDIASNLITGQGLAPQTWKDKYRQFKDFMTDPRQEPFTVYTGLDAYPSMHVVDVRPTREYSLAGAFFFTVTLEEVRIVSTSFLDSAIALLNEQSSGGQVARKKATKKQTTAQTSDATDKQQTSVLYDLMH